MRVERFDGLSPDLQFDEFLASRDGVASLHDTEAEAGDECGLDDLYDMDRLEALQLGVALDDIDGIQPRLA